MRALSYRFSVQTDDSALRRAIDGMFAALRVPGEAEHRYSLTVTPSTRGAEQVVVHRDDERVASCPDAATALSWLVWEVNRAAAAASSEHVLLHAGALQVDHNGPGLVLPGTSGSGKSTLSEWLARAGLPYLTDELVALDLDTRCVLPYPKPITRKPDGERGTEERHVAIRGDDGAARLGEPCVPGFVLFPRYVPGASAALVPLNETEAFLELAANAVNFADHGDVAASVLGSVVTSCACARLITSDVEEAGRLVLEFVGVRRAATERPGIELEAGRAV